MRDAKTSGSRKDNWRETIESIVIAFVLAFLFRTFELEPFVIPTGSMAPTLMGQHHDVDCPQCGYRYQVNASEEVDDDALALKASMAQSVDAARRYRDRMVASGTCPICRYTLDLEPGGKPKSYKGDRIIVAKFPYEFGDPDRWDVAVFKFPGESRTNYIKRIAGLPHETVRLQYGDLFTRPEGEDEFTIARKLPYKQWAIAQIVHDNDYAPSALLAAGWPSRWQSGTWRAADGALAFTSDAGLQGGFTSEDGNRSFSTDGTATEDVFLRYQHLLADDEVWREALVTGSVAESVPPKPQLISDFYAYNSKVSVGEVTSRGRIRPEYVPRHAEGFGLHWVGDLLFDCQVEVANSDGQIVLELVEGSVVRDGVRRPCRFQCTIDVATGEARMSIDGPDVDYAPVAQTVVKGPGTYRLALSNFDNQLTLWATDSTWFDPSPVEFQGSTEFPALGNLRPTPADLAPVGIASRGAAITVRHLRIRRDVYYIAAKHQNGGVITDYDWSNRLLANLSRETLATFLSTPSKWEEFDNMKSVEFNLGADQFLALGDNSPRSQDSRLWAPIYKCEETVRRELLIGEAVFIYWPHSWFFPIPAFKDMELVR